MSESSIKKKLSVAYAKAGRILGREYNLYRPIQLNGSLSTENFLRKQRAAFTIAEAFTTPQTESFKEYLAFTSLTDVEKGDIFDNCDETYVILGNRGLEYYTAIKATHLVEIWRPQWSTSGGLQSTRVRVAGSVPASVVKNSSVTDVVVQNVQQSSQSKRWDVRIVADDGEIIQTDNIKFANGIILHIDNIKVTEQLTILTCTEVKSE